jgi:hypothetical protein
MGDTHMWGDPHMPTDGSLVSDKLFDALTKAEIRLFYDMPLYAEVWRRFRWLVPQERHMADPTRTGLETQIPFSIEGKFMLESASKREWRFSRRPSWLRLNMNTAADRRSP